MLIVEGWVHFAPGEVDKLLVVARSMVTETLKEPGCLHYSRARDLDDPDLIRVSERWVDEAALEAHFSAPHMAPFGAALAQVERLGADVRIYSAEEVRRVM